MMNVALTVLSTISMLCSGSVIITIITSKMHTKFFNRIIGWISVCDFMGSLAGSLGNPASGFHGICFFQGFVVNISFSCSILWITLLSFSLYSIVIHEKIVLRQRYMHAIVWTIGLLKSLLPLSTLTYNHREQEWCNLTNVDGGGKEWTFILWDIVNYYLFIASAIGLVGYWSFCIHHRVLTGSISQSKTVQLVLEALYWYPITIVVSFGLELLIALSYGAGAHIPDPLWVAGEAMITLHGVCVTILFFSKSAEARNVWHQRIFGRSRETSTSLVSVEKGLTLNPCVSQESSAIALDDLNGRWSSGEISIAPASSNDSSTRSLQGIIFPSGDDEYWI